MLRSLVLATFSCALALDAVALSLGAEEFRGAQQLTCVMAEDALGYIDSESYDERMGEILDRYDEGAADAVYAKALGYIEGLMFGVDEGDRGGQRDRYLSLFNSKSCSAALPAGLRI